MPFSDKVTVPFCEGLMPYVLYEGCPVLQCLGKAMDTLKTKHYSIDMVKKKRPGQIVCSYPVVQCVGKTM